MDKTEESVGDALASLKAAIDEFWSTLDADEKLDDDERAQVGQLVEEASESIDDARKIVRDNGERE